MKFPKLTKIYPSFLTEVDLLVILANTPYQYLKDIFVTAFYTGIRLGEIINMRWNWIDFEKAQILLNVQMDLFPRVKRKE